VITEINPYRFIDYMPETKQFKITITPRGVRLVVDTLEEAMVVRDQIEASSPPKAKRYEPRREYATYVDPNLETRNYEA
jgi:hypothetical protein